jgi:hypothetical protein
LKGGLCVLSSGNWWSRPATQSTSQTATIQNSFRRLRNLHNMKSILTILALLGTVQVPYQDTYVAPLTPKEYAMEIVVSTWGIEEWQAFDEIIRKESNWSHTIKNPKSSAYGLCQTMLSLHPVEPTFMDSPEEQILWCTDYIKNRYGSPTKALAFHVRNGWF